MRREILQHHRTCHRMLAMSILLLLLSMTSGFVLTTDEQSPATENWNELVLRCRRSAANDGSDLVTKEGSLPVRQIRRLGSEFLGKRAMQVTLESLCSDWIFSEEIDDKWICPCIRNWDQPTLSANDQSMEEESSAVSVNKRGLGSIVLSGKRMNKERWNHNALNRRVLGSEFLGKRAILGSEFLGKRALMGSEFLGKRGSSGRSNGISGIVKI